VNPYSFGRTSGWPWPGRWENRYGAAALDPFQVLSCKYTRESFTGGLEATGLRLERWFTDPKELFALALLRRTEKGRWR
jgi:hypothetical protein